MSSSASSILAKICVTAMRDRLASCDDYTRVRRV
jgi:hypothetical protein